MKLPILLAAALCVAPAFASSSTPARSRGIRRAAPRRAQAPATRRRLQPRRLDGSSPSTQAGGTAGQAPQGYRPPGVSYNAPTSGTKAEQPGSGNWQPGFGAISGQGARPLGGAGVGGEGHDAAPAPSGGSGAGGNAITPNN